MNQDQPFEILFEGYGHFLELGYQHFLELEYQHFPELGNK